MPNEVMISFQDKQAILDAANKHFLVEENKDAPGHYSIQLYGDYRDTNEFLLQTAYDNRDNAENILPSLTDEIQTAWEETVSDAAFFLKPVLTRETTPLTASASGFTKPSPLTRLLRTIWTRT